METVEAVQYPWNQDNYYQEIHNRLRMIALLVGEQKSTSVLDLGCGHGLMRRLLPQGTAYFGCDGHWETPPYDDAPYEKWLFDSNAPVLPFAGKTFGAIACSGLIEYIEDQELLFRVIFERLAPGGYLLCSAINPLFPRYLMGRYRLPKGRWHPAWRKVRAWKAILADLQRVGFILESYAYIPDKETSEAASKRALETTHSLDAGIPNFLQFSHSQVLFIVRKPLDK